MNKMKKQIGILIFTMLLGAFFAPIVFADSVGHEVPGVLSTPTLQSPGMSGTVNNCNPLTVAHGTVAAYPTCTITCASGYTLSGTTCVTSSTVCSPASVANGSVAAFPSCAITCNSGYTLSGTTCIVQNSGGGGGGGGGGGSVGSSSPTSTVGGDFNGDGKVNMVDMNTLMLNWGGSGPIGDLNNDGKVDILDFNMLMINWTV
jgi:uncharacterized membrane protein YgcG